MSVSSPIRSVRADPAPHQVGNMLWIGLKIGCGHTLQLLLEQTKAPTKLEQKNVAGYLTN